MILHLQRTNSTNSTNVSYGTRSLITAFTQAHTGPYFEPGDSIPHTHILFL